MIIHDGKICWPMARYDNKIKPVKLVRFRTYTIPTGLQLQSISGPVAFGISPTDSAILDALSMDLASIDEIELSETNGVATHAIAEKNAQSRTENFYSEAGATSSKESTFQGNHRQRRVTLAKVGALGIALFGAVTAGASEASYRIDNPLVGKPDNTAPALLSVTFNSNNPSFDAIKTPNSAWNHIMDRLHYLSQLPDNWDGYGTETPNSTTVTRSGKALSILQTMGFAPSGIVPSAENGLAIVFQDDARYADIEFFNTGEIFVGMTPPAGEPIVIEIRPEEADITHALERIRLFFHE